MPTTIVHYFCLNLVVAAVMILNLYQQVALVKGVAYFAGGRVQPIRNLSHLITVAIIHIVPGIGAGVQPGRQQLVSGIVSIGGYFGRGNRPCKDKPVASPIVGIFICSRDCAGVDGRRDRLKRPCTSATANSNQIC